MHIQHLLSDKYYTNLNHVMCFTETDTNSASFQRIEEYHPDWKSIHHPNVEHGLAIYYNTKEVVIEKEFPETSFIELLSLLMNIDGEITLSLCIDHQEVKDICLFNSYNRNLACLKKYVTIRKFCVETSTWSICFKKMLMLFSN